MLLYLLVREDQRLLKSYFLFFRCREVELESDALIETYLYSIQLIIQMCFLWIIPKRHSACINILFILNIGGDICVCSWWLCSECCGFCSRQFMLFARFMC